MDYELIGTIVGTVLALGAAVWGGVALALRGPVAQLSGKIDTLHAELRGEMGILEVRLGGEINTLHRKVDKLDRDAQRLYVKVFHEEA